MNSWFRPDLSSLKAGTARDLESLGHNLKKITVEDAGLSPVGTLRHTLDYARNSKHELDGVFAAIRQHFGAESDKVLFEGVQKVNSFRNTYIAHQVKELTDVEMCEDNLKVWIATLGQLHNS